MMFVFACALMGCGSDSGSGSDSTVINGLVGLAAGMVQPSQGSPSTSLMRRSSASQARQRP